MSLVLKAFLYMLSIKSLILFFTALVICDAAMAQNDSIIFKNGNYIIGEIKSMDRGVMTVETDYSDSDFKIEWVGVSQVYSNGNFLITLSDGHRYNGTLQSTAPSKLKINAIDVDTTEIDISDVVFFKPYKYKFWNRFTGSVDVGYSFTKANNYQQLDVRSNLDYRAAKWSASASYDQIRSTQDNVEPTRRTDGGLTFRKLLPKDWYASVNYAFLSNTEQKLDLRNNIKSGIGKYIVHTNRAYFGCEAGISYVDETFTGEDNNRTSLEAYAGTEANLYDIGDLNFLSRLVVYPGITEKGRIRTDFNLDTKYDLPLDFYIKVGFTLNFDNQTAEGASSTDYVFQTGFGWELDN